MKVNTNGCIFGIWGVNETMITAESEEKYYEYEK